MKIDKYLNTTINQWTILSLDEKQTKNKNRTYAICRCNCGKIKSVDLSSIIYQRSKSCGCLRKITMAETGKKNLIDLTGQKFGKLTVISKNEKYGKNKNRVYWNCLCECGNTCIVLSSNLKTNQVLSCGCLISKGEQKIREILNELKYDYISQYSFSNLIGDSRPLKFDFAILKDEKLLCLIEYQGKQHYRENCFLGGEKDFKKRLEYDKKKEEYCNQNKIPLIIIPYTDFNKINSSYLRERLEVL